MKTLQLTDDAYESLREIRAAYDAWLRSWPASTASGDSPGEREERRLWDKYLQTRERNVALVVQGVRFDELSK